MTEDTRPHEFDRRRRVWLETFSDLGGLLQPPMTPEEGFARISDALYAACQAGAIAVVQVPAVGRPYVAARTGTMPDRTPEQIAYLGQAVRTVATSDEPAYVGIEPGSSVLIVPLRAHLSTPGVLVVWFDRAHDEEEASLVAAFAEHAGLALDRAQALENRAEMAVVSERDRIARDLHDVVIQRLFAAGLRMQATLPLATTPALTERLEETVRDLDQTIRDIRGTIFELQRPPQHTIRSQVRDLVREYSPLLGFSPAVQLTGPVDTTLEPEFQHHLTAVLREALSNVARHAQATAATVFLEVGDTQVRLVVSDEGIGLAPQRHESGLANAKERAELLGGTVELVPNHPRGTSLRWTAPLPLP